MIVVAYDIPESQSSVRKKFRRQLVRWGFVRIQQSVWQIDGNLPLGFGMFVRDYGLFENVRVYVISDNSSR